MVPQRTDLRHAVASVMHVATATVAQFLGEQIEQAEERLHALTQSPLPQTRQELAARQLEFVVMTMNMASLRLEIEAKLGNQHPLTGKMLELAIRFTKEQVKLFEQELVIHRRECSE